MQCINRAFSFSTELLSCRLSRHVRYTLLTADQFFEQLTSHDFLSSATSELDVPPLDDCERPTQQFVDSIHNVWLHLHNALCHSPGVSRCMAYDRLSHLVD